MIDIAEKAALEIIQRMPNVKFGVAEVDRKQIAKEIIEEAVEEVIDKTLAIIGDDDLAERVAKCCRDNYHDDRYCPTCSSRSAGIEDYQEAIKRKIL